MWRDYGWWFHVSVWRWREVHRKIGIRELNCVMEVKLRQTLLLWNMRVGDIWLTRHTRTFRTKDCSELVCELIYQRLCWQIRYKNVWLCLCQHMSRWSGAVHRWQKWWRSEIQHGGLTLVPRILNTTTWLTIWLVHPLAVAILLYLSIEVFSIQRLLLSSVDGFSLHFVLR